jgi:hypothetical protein
MGVSELKHTAVSAGVSAFNYQAHRYIKTPILRGVRLYHSPGTYTHSTIIGVSTTPPPTLDLSLVLDWALDPQVPRPPHDS